VGSRRPEKATPCFRDDGKLFTLYHAEKNVFTDAPAPPTIDAAVDNVRQRFDIEAPAGDLIVGDTYKALMECVSSGALRGARADRQRSSAPPRDDEEGRRPFQLWNPRRAATPCRCAT